ncbi:MAG: hypothetical protein IIC85_13165, partial [Chloroflexi bacterium]|nr:hypothetical protein [Chloroflexota bacterium]
APSVSPKQQVASILSAHRELIELNEKNRDVFQNIVDALEADLRRHEGNAQLPGDPSPPRPPPDA